MIGKFGGEVSEWTKEYAWRAYVPSNRNRGFESHPLRFDSQEGSLSR